MQTKTIKLKTIKKNIRYSNARCKDYPYRVSECWGKLTCNIVTKTCDSNSVTQKTKQTNKQIYCSQKTNINLTKENYISSRTLQAIFKFKKSFSGEKHYITKCNTITKCKCTKCICVTTHTPTMTHSRARAPFV